jgi:branched-chain amino acid transport system ATP-binding protein
VIAGIIQPRSGGILLREEPLHGKPPRYITSRGVSWVPQEDNVFPAMTVRENLEMGAFLIREDIRDRVEEACDIFPQLRDRMGQ